MFGGRLRWRAFLSDDVSPLRLSTLMSSSISAIGPRRLRSTSAERLQRRYIEGVEPVGRVPREIDETRQKPRQGLARPRRRDEQSVFAALARGKHIGLMPPEPPPARGEPVGERGGERHGRDVARRGTGDKSPGLFVLQGISGFGRLRTILPGTGRGTTEGGGGARAEPRYV